MQQDSTILQIGSAIFLFELIYTYRQYLDDQMVDTIVISLFQIIPAVYQQELFDFLVCILEIIVLIGQHPAIQSNIKLLISLFLEPTNFVIEHRAFMAVYNQGYVGLYFLMDIATKEINEIPIKILTHIVQVGEIRREIIIENLMNELCQQGCDPKRKLQILAMFNRLAADIDRNYLGIFCGLLENGSVDRQQIASIIHCMHNNQELIFKVNLI